MHKQNMMTSKSLQHEQQQQQIDQPKVQKRKTQTLDGLEFTVPLPKESR